MYLVQAKEGCQPVADERNRNSKATVLKPEDVEIKEIHVLRGYKILNNKSGYAALDSRDISLFLI